MSDTKSQKLLLEGCKVLDMTQYLAGAGVTRLMAELGADIIKVEIAPVGDPGRLIPIVKNERSGFFVQHNRGKKSLCLDWEKPEALSILKKLSASVDIVAENFGRADILARRGLSYEKIRDTNPGIIYLSISAFGRKGPWSQKTGYDYIAQAASGLMHMTGEPDRPPAIVWSALADTNAAVHGFASLGYALYHRERTGEGQFIDLSMTDCLFHVHEAALESYHLSDHSFVPKRYGTNHALVFPMGTFKGPQGWIVVIALDLQWKNVCKAIGRTDLIEDLRSSSMPARAKNQAELREIIETWMATFETDEQVLEIFEEHRVPASPVLSPVDAIDHPHFKARNMVRWVSDPILDEIPIPGFPFKFGAQTGLPEIEAPLLGEHNEYILDRELGFTKEQIRDLVDAGVLFQEPR